MQANAQPVRVANYRALSGAGLLACALLSLAGCERAVVYRANKVPPEFLAAPVRSAQSLNISRLSGASVNPAIIQPDDILDVSLVTGLEQERPTSWLLRVSADGMANVPLVGPVQVGGLDLKTAEQVLHAESIRREIYRQPLVSISFHTRRSNIVTVVGEVKEPGVKKLPVASSQLVDALVAAGGLTPSASMFVEVRYPPDTRGDVQQASFQDGPPVAGRIMTVSLAELEAVGGQMIPLSDGTVLTVVKRPPETIDVIGLVRKPGQYEIPPDDELRLLGALALAGGRSMQIASKVKVIRTIPGRNEPIVIKTTVGKAKDDQAANLRLAAGDVVSVEETPTTFVIETVRNFMRFGLSSPIPGL